MTEEEYYDWLRAAGFEPIGDGTLITEEWSDRHGTFIMLTRASELSPDDRAAAIKRFEMYLAINRPIGGGGVH